MISGVGLASTLAGVKSDFTDQEGLARRASRSSEGLVLEDSVRVVDAFVIWISCNLADRMVLRLCLGNITRVLLRDEVPVRNVCRLLEICRADLPLVRADRRTSILFLDFSCRYVL